MVDYVEQRRYHRPENLRFQPRFVIRKEIRMSVPRLFSRARLLICAALVGMLMPMTAGVSFAQDVVVLSIDALSSQTLSGAATFKGFAVNCTTGQPATRVAVYDGPNSSTGTYLADVSMDNVRDVASACPSGSPKAMGNTGFTLIFDTNKLSNGNHTLAFVATYAGTGNATVNSTALVQVTINNLKTASSVLTPYVPSYVIGPSGTMVATYGNPFYAPYYSSPYYGTYLYNNALVGGGYSTLGYSTLGYPTYVNGSWIYPSGYPFYNNAYYSTLYPRYSGLTCGTYILNGIVYPRYC
jgi:hypothetical protein